MLTRTSPATDRFVEIDGLRMHCRDHGEAHAPTVVVLHGIMGHAREWDVLTATLAERFRVIAVDQRGHGLSDWAPEYTATALAADVVQLADQLGLGSLRLIGHSMGGMAAMLAAARTDVVERLVVVDIGPESLGLPFAAQLPGMLRALAAARYTSVDAAVADWLGDPLARPELVRHYVEHCLERGCDGRLRYRFDGEGLIELVERGVDTAQLWAAAGEIRCPTLLIRGERSEVFPRSAAHELARRIDRCELAVIPRGSHDLGVQQPETVAAAALELLRG